MAYSIYSKAGTDEAISSALADSLPTAPADIGAATAAQGALADTAVQPEDLGTAAAADAGDFATAAQGAKADASDVDQITLTGDLALTLPVGHPAGQVYRVTFTQDGVGGHTVTYGGNAVTVALTAGASTTVELHPVGSGYVLRYPSPVGDITPLGELPTPSTAYATSPDPGNIFLMDSEDRLLRYNPSNNRQLQRSSDLGATWETIWTVPLLAVGAIEGCRQLDSGELLVGASGNGTNILPALWRTTGYDSGTPTWTKVLESATHTLAFTLRWAYSCSGSTIVVAPYDGAVPPNRSAKQAVYKSTDDGMTWAEIYDHGQDGTGARHIHGLAIDPYRNAIWLSLGDSASNRGIKVSWDGGTTWQSVSTTMQPTVIYAFPECIVFGTDQAPNGVWRIDNPSTTSLVVGPAYLIAGGGTAVTHVAEQWFRRPGGPLLIPYTVPASRVTMVLASYDGYAWFELWRSPAAVNAAAGARYAVGPSSDGRYVITGPAAPGRMRVDVTDRPALISAVARMGRHLSMGLPRVSRASFGTAAGQIITNEGNQNNIQLNAVGGNLLVAGDPWELFDLDADGVSVVVKRSCRVVVYAHVPFSTSNLVSPTIIVRLGEERIRAAKMATTTSVAFRVAAGQKIRITAAHLSGSPVALEASTSVLQIEAWEDY